VQTTPVEERIGYLLKQAQHALRTAMDRALRERGLTTPQYAVLTALAEQSGLSNAELARRAFVTPQTMNSIVVLLERAGLVERRPHDRHGRVLATILTPTGAALVQSCHEAVERIEQQMLAPFNGLERVQLATLLRSCVTALRNGRQPRRKQAV
jgi:DNA-binding MarR family transcriptional regulator